MATFAYQALTAAGERVSGEIDAIDVRGAVQRLQDGGLIPIEALPVASRAAGGSAAGSGRGGASASQLTAATRELATLIGTYFGARLLREKAAPSRILGAVCIVAGVVSLALADAGP